MRMTKLSLSILVPLLAATLLVSTRSADARSQPPLRTTLGAVAADNTLASNAGTEVLAAGGSAADAAVAVATVLGVTQPFASGLGGGGFCLYFDANSGQVSVYDFREVAPAAATADMFLDAEGNAQPALSQRGGLAVAVPGELAGLAALHAAHGRRPWATNFAAAISLARHGYPAGSLLVARVASTRAELEVVPGMRTWLLPDGDIPELGQILTNPALADLLTAIADEGPTAFYSGERAAAIAAAVQAAGGILTAEDLAAYRVVEREAVRGTYRGHEVYSMPPPSSGGIAVIETLNILSGWDVSAQGAGSSRAWHHLAEALKFSFADRANFLGDPAFVDVPVERLTSVEYADELRARISADGVLAAEAYGPLRYAKDDTGTSHFSIIDREGNAASCTTTVNLVFGSMVYVDALGLVLNNEMDDFVQKPGQANAFGLVGTDANAVAPGKRPLSSMSPTLLVRDGQVVMAVGGSGGPAIITGVVQAIVNVVDFGMDARAAVEAPRIHHQWLPHVLVVEPEVSADVVENLRARGHEVTTREAWGAVQIATVEGGVRAVASDPRKHGEPAVEPSTVRLRVPNAQPPSASTPAAASGAL